MRNEQNHPGPDVRIVCIQHYKEYRPGQTYTVDPYTAQQLIEAHKAYKIKDMSDSQIAIKRGVGRPRKIAVVIDGILH